MSFAARFCSNFVRNSWGLLAGHSYANGSTPNRFFHVIMRSPAPHTMAPAQGLGSLSSSPSSGSVMSGVVGLLAPSYPQVTQVAGFKVKGKLKPRCKDCYYVIRQQRHYIICPTHPRHKQMSMKKRDYKSWILTHATQSKVRPF